MDALRSAVDAFVALVTAGRTVEAIERFYAEDVCVFENRELARAGRRACVTAERGQLAAQATPPRIEARSVAVDPASQTAFIEWRIRFHASDGRPMRLEEVAVQRWSRGAIVEERFYYEGFIDEG